MRNRPSDRIIDAALRLGELKLGRGLRGKWAFGRRSFDGSTVKRAIEAGVAVRVGNTVRSTAQHARQGAG